VLKNKFNFTSAVIRSIDLLVPNCTRNHSITHTNCTPLSSITIINAKRQRNHENFAQSLMHPNPFSSNLNLLVTNWLICLRIEFRGRTLGHDILSNLASAFPQL